MATSTSNFKLILIGVFVAATVIGVLVFSGIIDIGPGDDPTDVEGTAIVWGTIDSRAMRDFIGDFNLRNEKITITYIQQNSSTFASDLVNAIASGTAPDLVIIPDNLVWRFSDKLSVIPYGSLPQRVFQDTFVTGANIFSVPGGSLAIPWAADPLVMYYNRNLLEAEGIAKAPTTWTEFIETVPLLTKRDGEVSLSQSAAAFGTYRNITHVKDIIALLFMSGGNPFVTTGATQPTVHFGSLSGQRDNAVAEQAMDFFMAFSDPTSSVYSWNSGENQDRNAFVSSELAYYFGTASELPVIREQNPNLNFNIVLPPQAEQGLPVTTGRFYGLAIPKSAKNPTLSYIAATGLTNTASAQALIKEGSTTLALMSVRRDVLAQKPADDPYLSLLYNVTLVMRSWLDPDTTLTENVLSTLVSDLNSGILDTSQALSKASSQIATQSIRSLQE